MPAEKPAPVSRESAGDARAGSPACPHHRFGYRHRVVATNDEHPLDVSTVATLDHVRGRLADEFGSRITAADITRYVAQAHKDLGHPSPAALPELLERLVRVRPLDRVGGPPDSGGR